MRVSLFKYKNFLVKYTPVFFSNYVLFLWRGPLSFLRNGIEKNRYSKNIKPYFKQIFYKDLEVEMYVDVTESWVSREVDLRGIHEEHILEKIIDNLKEGDTFIDVGANVGHHALFAAKRVEKTGRVFAFEPVPSSAENILKSKEKNNFTQLEIIQKAVSNTKDVISFYVYPYSDISGKTQNFTDRTSKKIKVQQIILDEELFENKKIIRCDLIKIDVEGYEYDTLIGGEKIIDQYKPKIILEYSPVFYERLNPSHSYEILRFLQNKKYRLFDIDNYVGEITSIETYIKEIKKHGNISNILCI